MNLKIVAAAEEEKSFSWCQLVIHKNSDELSLLRTYSGLFCPKPVTLCLRTEQTREIVDVGFNKRVTQHNKKNKMDRSGKHVHPFHKVYVTNKSHFLCGSNLS